MNHPASTTPAARVVRPAEGVSQGLRKTVEEATTAADSGLIVYYRTRAVKNKGPGEQLTITVRVIYT